MADKQERITQATKIADRKAAGAEHGASQVPSADEIDAAERHPKASPGTADHYEEMTGKGAAHKGEGRLP